MTQVSPYVDVPEAEYHTGNGLSASGAKLLLASPAKFKYTRDHPVYKDEFDFGSVAHKLVLGAGADVEIVIADSWRSKAAQEHRDAIRANGQIPILAADHAKAVAMSRKVREHPLARKLLAEGIAEQSGYWQDQLTGVGLRFRPDWITTHILVDYKTAVSADPKVFARKAYDYGYHIQDAWYTTGHEALTGEQPDFYFIVQEKEPPFLVSVVALDTDALLQGRLDMRRAIDLYAQCVESGVWPGYPDEAVTVSLPPWAISHEARQGRSVPAFNEDVWGRP